MPSYVKHHNKFKPFVIQGDEWVRYVAVCRMVHDEGGDDPFGITEFFVDVVCEYASQTPPDAFDVIHTSWHRDGVLSNMQEDYFARIALQKLQDGTAYVEVPA